MNAFWSNEKYGRTILIGGSLLVWAVILFSMRFAGYEKTWQFWQIPVEMPPFIDLRLIPSGAEAFRAGLDPAVSNPTDPAGHIFNYPKIWYLFFYTGVSQKDTIWLAVVLISLFFITTFVFPDRISTTTGLLMLAVLFSPAVMLLCERGNVDLAFYVLCGLVVVLIKEKPAWAVGILSVASIFKFFPFFGVGSFLQEDHRKFWKMALVTAFFFAVYIVFNYRDISAAWELTMRGTTFSYGVSVLTTEPKIVDFLAAKLNLAGPRKEIIKTLNILFYCGALLLSIVSVLLGLGRRDKGITSTRNMAAFRMGAFIYAGTFFLGNNWDYRLAFLLFTLPQISIWLLHENMLQRGLAFAAGALILLSCWYAIYFVPNYPDLYLRLLVLDEAVNWMLFGLMSFFLAYTVPSWVRNFMHGLFPFYKKQAEVVV